MNENDSLNTLPSGIIEQLSERAKENPQKYRPSYIARILSKSIASSYQRNDTEKVLRKGHFIESKNITDQMMIDRVKTISFEGKVITYIDMSFPGLNFGKEIFKELDTKMTELKIDMHNLKEVYLTAAFLTICAATIHAFLDANGRVAVGLADTFLRSSLNNTFDYLLLGNNNSRLADSMISASLSLLPDGYNPRSVLNDLSSSGKTQIRVYIPHLENASPWKVKKFLTDYTQNIITFIRNFNPQDLKRDNSLTVMDTNYHLFELASLYIEAFKPYVPQNRAHDIGNNMRDSFAGQ